MINPFPAAFFLTGVDVLQVGLMLRPNDGVLVNHSSGTSSYIGAGDLVSGATAWYGLRAYSAAQATGTQKAINIRRASDNATTDILILATGNLDIATATTFLAATTGFIATWYDQSGHGCHATQGTPSSQPAFALTGGPTKVAYCIVWSGAVLPLPQRSQERTHFCSPELTQRVRMCLWSFGQISRYLTCPKATIPLFDCGNHSSAPTWVPRDMASAGGQ